MEGAGSPVTEHVMLSLEPTSLTTEPSGWSLTRGTSWMMSCAVTSTTPALFSARHLYICITSCISSCISPVYPLLLSGHGHQSDGDINYTNEDSF